MMRRLRQLTGSVLMLLDGVFIMVYIITTIVSMFLACLGMLALIFCAFAWIMQIKWVFEPLPPSIAPTVDAIMWFGVMVFVCSAIVRLLCGFYLYKRGYIEDI